MTTKTTTKTATKTARKADPALDALAIARKEAEAAAKAAKAQAAAAAERAKAAKAATEAAKADAKARAEANAAAIAEAASTYGSALADADATLADAARAVALAILRTGLKVTAEAMGKGCGADRLPATAANYASRLNAIAAAHGNEDAGRDAETMLDNATTQGAVFKACEAIRDALGAKSSVGRKSNAETAKGAKGATQQQVETQEAAKVEAEAAHEAATVAEVVDSGNAEATIALCDEALAAFRIMGDAAHKLGNKALAGILADAQARVRRHRDGVKTASI